MRRPGESNPWLVYGGVVGWVVGMVALAYLARALHIEPMVLIFGTTFALLGVVVLVRRRIEPPRSR